MAKKISKNIRVPYALSFHGKDELRAVSRVISEHRTSIGRETKQFEKEISSLFGKKYGVALNSGSSANLLAFELLNLPPGSEVITPVLTFSTTVAPILQRGLRPVFVDIDPKTFLIDIGQIKNKISKKTKVLMIPSLLGNVPNMAKLRAIANEHKLFLVEDSCDTLGARFNGVPSGKYSDISTTSFYGSHIINAAGGGGMILVNRADWYRRLLVLRGWGRSSGLFAESEDLSERFKMKLAGAPYDGKFFFTEVGYNFLPLEIGSAFGLAQLKKFPDFVERRRDNFKEIAEFFSKWPQFFSLPRETPGAETTWLAFPISIKEGSPFSRLEIVKYLEKANIQTRPVFTGNIMYQPAFRHLSHKNFEKQYPGADYVMHHSFLIGCHQGLTSLQLGHMKNTFSEFMGKYL